MISIQKTTWLLAAVILLALPLACGEEPTDREIAIKAEKVGEKFRNLLALCLFMVSAEVRECAGTFSISTKMTSTRR